MEREPEYHPAEEDVPLSGRIWLFHLYLHARETFLRLIDGNLYGSMLVQHLAGYIPEDREEKTRDFFDLNLKLSYDFPIFKSATLQVNAGIQNIFDSYQDDFDKGAHRDAGYIYGPGIPRSYFVGCKISY